MKIEATFFRSKVARRIFVLFIVCALVPILALSLISWREVSRQMEHDRQVQLRESSKAEAMAIYGRLELLNSELKLQSALGSGATPIASTHFSNVRFETNFDQSTLSEQERQHLSASKPLLKISAANSAKASIVMLRYVDAQRPDAGMLIGEIEPEYLWDTASVPENKSICVQTASGINLSTCEAKSLTVGRENGRGDSGYFTSKTKDTVLDAAYWSLFLRPSYGSSSWIIIVSEDHRSATVALREFTNTFPLVALLARWTVLLLSMKQIRRTLIPLEQLRESTQQIGAQNFAARVDVRSGDEFEELGNSVNAMAFRLGRQFDAVKTINKIDQAILTALNREGIIDALLEHMPKLMPCDVFAITIFDAEKAQAISHLSQENPGGFEKRILRDGYKLADLKWFDQSKDWALIHSDESLPFFLSPLKNLGLNSFSVFPITVEGKIFSALVFSNASNNVPELEDLELCRQVSHQLSVAFANVHLIEALEQLNLGTLTALARAIDAKSAWTAGHSERVTNLAIRIGQQMGLTRKEQQILHRGGLLHDIGKIGTPPVILDKPAELTPEETATMQNHVNIGLRILEPLPGFSEALPIVSQHHEWFNGKGYPNKLSGNEISLYARIFAVADVYDAVTSNRPYRAGLPKAKAIEVIRQKSGTQFDPAVVKSFLELMESEADVPQQEPAVAGVK